MYGAKQSTNFPVLTTNGWLSDDFRQVTLIMSRVGSDVAGWVASNKCCCCTNGCNTLPSQAVAFGYTKFECLLTEQGLVCADVPLGAANPWMFPNRFEVRPR